MSLEKSPVARSGKQRGKIHIESKGTKGGGSLEDKAVARKMKERYSPVDVVQ